MFAFSQQEYNATIHDAVDFRTCIEKQIELFPELSSAQITKVYLMKYIYY